MLFREGFLALALGLALTACGGDDKADAQDATRLPTPTADLTEVTIECDEFEGAAKKIAGAQAELYAGLASGSSPGPNRSVEPLIAELDALKQDAPADVKDALTGLGEGFRAVEQLLENPTSANQAELSALAEDLSADGQKVTAYITSQCG